MQEIQDLILRLYYENYPEDKETVRDQEIADNDQHCILEIWLHLAV